MKTSITLLVITFLGLGGRFCASNAQKVIISQNGGSTQWTCFGHDSSETCCQSIETASRQASIPTASLASCNLLLAEIPQESVSQALQTSSTNIARFSLINRSTPDPETQQFVFEESKESFKLEKVETTIFPFVLGATLDQSNSLSISSELSSSGGMHRLLSHRLETMVDFSKCFIFLTVPHDMFVDLDDAYEPPGDNTILRVHAAGVCDIEQPAFASGQHAIVLELEQDANPLSFASKFHVRYPYPSPTYSQYVHLPEPQLLCTTYDGSLVGTAPTKDAEVVWVAAGSDEDHDFVMWTTVLMCCFGVVWMMSDISHVARWDE